jgi:hypothetical protein
MNLEFEISVPRQFTPNIVSKTKNDVKLALEDLKFYWQLLLLKQIRTLQPVWDELNPKYKARKQRDFAAGRIRYLYKLGRNGDLLNSYIQGVTVDVKESSTFVPYGTKYAYYHQHSKSRKLPRREFDLLEFEKVAIDTFKNRLLNG